MSKLTRYKKAPAVKLPRNLLKESSVPPDDDNDDDDFQAPRSVPLAFKEPSVEKEKVSMKSKAKSKVCIAAKSVDYKTSQTCNKSQSEYFLTDDKQVEVKSSSEKSGNKRQLAQKEKQPILESKDDNGVVETLRDQDEHSPSVPPDPDNVAKAVCPFCWKVLSDKLTGTTHVKACAKNIPTNQVLNAMELQDKQIKEWEDLGIAYPGFVGATTAATKGGSRRGRAGASNRAARAPRKKKQDPDLDLAMALSASLHEEVEKRKTKEKEFMVTNGLAHEIQLSNNKKQEIKADTTKFQISKTISEMATNAQIRKRGKKVNLQDLPLYKASESDRKLATEGRLSQILDENYSVKQEDVNGFNVRDPTTICGLKPSSKLEAYINKDARLWKLSGVETTSNEEFTTQAILECKARNKEDVRNLEGSTTGREVSRQRDRLLSQERRNEIVARSEKPRGTNLSDDESKVKPVLERNVQVKAEGTKRVQPADFKSQRNERRAMINQNTEPWLPKVVEDILNMLLSKQDVDLVIYAREEKPIKCHKLIIKARCPSLLKESVIETSSRGSKREVVPLTSFSHVAVKAFVRFIYSGQFGTDLSGHDKEDVQELSRKYMLDLDSESNLRSARSSTKSKAKDVQTQTEADKQINEIKVPDVKTEHPIIVEIKSKAVARVSLDMFASQVEAKAIPKRSESTGSQDMFLSGDEDLFPDVIEERFTTIVAEHSHLNKERSVEVQRRQTIGLTDADGQSRTEAVPNGDRGRRDGSRDLFEDDFEDVYEEPQAKDGPELNDLDRNISQNSFKSISKDGSPRSIDNGILDDEIFTQLGPQILLSPKPSKRTRSMSPSFQFRNTSGEYTDTQMAEYLNLKEDQLIPDSPCSQQANKKHKLDLDSTVVENDNVNGNDSITLLDLENSVSYPRVSTSSDFRDLRKDTFGTIESEKSCNFKELRKDTFGTFDSRKNSNVSAEASSNQNSQPSPCPTYSMFSKYINQNTALSTTPLANPVLSRNFFSNSNPVSPILAPQTVEANDPFADDMDDSCFANIPSQLLRPNESLLEKIPEIYPQPPPQVSIPSTPILSQRQNSTRAKAKTGSQLKKCAAVDDCNGNVERNKKRTVRKSPRNVSVSQPQVKLPQQPSTPPTSGPNQLQRTNKTPLLNYSTIDTPILKKELKRYGLKPLPRSKAKLILRHIYAETHK